MNDTQPYISVGVPFFTLLLVYVASTVSNRGTVNDLRAEMRAGFTAINQRLDDTNGRISRLENRLDAIDNEIRISHERRLATLEARVLGRAS